jgi:hypothetical protein
MVSCLFSTKPNTSARTAKGCARCPRRGVCRFCHDCQAIGAGRGMGFASEFELIRNVCRSTFRCPSVITCWDGLKDVPTNVVKYGGN